MSRKKYIRKALLRVLPYIHCSSNHHDNLHFERVCFRKKWGYHQDNNIRLNSFISYSGRIDFEGTKQHTVIKHRTCLGFRGRENTMC